MNNILKKSLNVLILILGFTWITLFIFRYPIRSWLLHLNNIYVFSFVILLLILAILTLIHSLSIKFNTTPLKQIVKGINNALQVLYWNPLNEIFNQILKKIPKTGDILMAIGRFLQQRINVSHPIKNFAILSSMIVAILPRIILCSIFFLSVYLNIRILFVIVPFLVFYILIMRLFVYILYTFAIENIAILLLYFDVTYLGKGKGYSIQLKPELVEKYQDKLELYASRYFLFRDIGLISNAIQIERERLYSYLKKPLNIVYLIGLIKLVLTLSNILIPAEVYLVALYECLIIWLIQD
jgi:hypothetical protein